MCCRCSSQCPRCTFPRAGIATGHCQRRRRLFSCRRNRNDGDSGNEGNEGDEGNEGNEGDEGDEGNEGNEGDEGNMENWNSRLAMAPEGLLDEDYDEDYDEEVGEEYFYEFDDGTVREEGPEIVVMNKLGSFALDGDHDLLPEIAPEHEDPEYVDEDEETGEEEEEEEGKEGDDDDTEGSGGPTAKALAKTSGNSEPMTVIRIEVTDSTEADKEKPEYSRNQGGISRIEMFEDD